MRQDGVKYKATEGKQESQATIEAENGYYDEDGFYIIHNEDGTERGDFYDPNGFYFDQEGYDKFGGYYDDDLNYIPGKEYEEEYYRRLKEEEEQVRQYKEAVRLENIFNHINPCVNHVKLQPPETKFVIKIENINKKIMKLHLERLLRQLLKNAGHTDVPEAKEEGDFEKATKSKIVIDSNNKGENLGQAWFQSTHRDCIIELLKLHKKVWSNHVLRTFLMGFAYDDEEAEDEDDDFKVNKEYLKGGQFE